MCKKRLLGMFLAAMVFCAGVMGFTHVVGANAADGKNYGSMRDIPAANLLAEMTVGWNLGNTLDSHGSGAVNETQWGNPRTTKEMIDTISNKGINTIRIPVTLAENVGGAPDYTINQAWLSRIKEIVDYAFANNMYVILDAQHHDTNYWLKPIQNEAVIQKFTSLWTQIANCFKDYGDHLIFEGMNEVRTIGSANEWSGGTPEERAVINNLNEAFVRTVRNTGGNNAKRCLIISPYGNAATENAMADLRIPQNDNHIMVAIHAYTPYAFTFQPNTDWEKFTWDGSLKGDIDYVMELANRYFVSKGTPVILTEFGAVSKQITVNGATKQNTSEVIKWLKDYMSAANRYNIKCVWWDNGYYVETRNPSNEVFGIFNRYNLTWYQPEVADALIRNAKGQ
ncbi:endoglucanase [Anaerocolumna cellulosilytica]|uniref:Endoglucanase n=1 Tax=Anaerocolumna cellulosilytica TaxID=433286 RepID=A0A6S6QWV6_9FIRM|nr:glycoside hydrolase family 5 protein [Anaerocolumna cellulosilytica]MBB5194830.1 endoglucanase [Anaerocolumna cellulosilytica]BCJ94206.1 endoglucanase [Anaerocolumna cellulosilytica]